MLSIASATYAFAPVAPLNPSTTRSASVKMESVADLKTLSEKLNPVVGFWEPIGLTANVGDTEEATVGWYRHAEIKHGRVAMAAFVGFCVQSNGICFPWDLANGVSFASISAAGGPGAQWDALPTSAKMQIIGFVGFLEMFSETSVRSASCPPQHFWGLQQRQNIRLQPSQQKSRRPGGSKRIKYRRPLLSVAASFIRSFSHTPLYSTAALLLTPLSSRLSSAVRARP